MEEGEAEIDDLSEIIKNLDPATREKYEKGELNEEDLIQMGLIPPFGEDEAYGAEDDLDFGEEGEEDQDDSADPAGAAKRQKHDSDEEWVCVKER